MDEALAAIAAAGHPVDTMPARSTAETERPAQSRQLVRPRWSWRTTAFFSSPAGCCTLLYRVWLCARTPYALVCSGVGDRRYAVLLRQAAVVVRRRTASGAGLPAAASAEENIESSRDIVNRRDRRRVLDSGHRRVRMVHSSSGLGIFLLEPEARSIVVGTAARFFVVINDLSARAATTVFVLLERRHSVVVRAVNEPRRSTISLQRRQSFHRRLQRRQLWEVLHAFGR